MNKRQFDEALECLGYIRRAIGLAPAGIGQDTGYAAAARLDVLVKEAYEARAHRKRATPPAPVSAPES